MPVDTSIYSLLGHNVTPLKNPMEIMGNALQMRMQQLAVQKGMQEQQDVADFRQKFGVSPGIAQAAQKMALADQERINAVRLGQKTHADTVNALAEQQNRVYRAAQDALARPDADPAAIHLATVDAIKRNAQQYGIDTTVSDDPTFFKSLDDQKNWLQSKVDATTPAAVRAKLDELALQRERLNKEKKGPIEMGLDLYNQGRPAPVSATDKGFMGWYQGMSHPKNSMGGAGGMGGMGGMGSSVAPEDKATSIQNAAIAMVQGRQSLPKGRETTDSILGPAAALARKIDPTLSDSTVKLRQNAQKDWDTGKLGQSNNAIGTVLGHLAHLKDDYQNLGDVGVKSGNWLLEKAKEFGPGGNPNLQSVYDRVEAIGPEMSKAYMPGGGTESERAGWKERINPFRPMPERKASLQAFAEMLITKLNSNEAQYLKSFKGLSPNAMPADAQLTEDGYNALKEIQAWTGKPIKGADKWISRYERDNGAIGNPDYDVPSQGAKAATAKPTPSNLPYRGKVASQADLEATAKARGLSVTEVKRRWISGGGSVQ